MKSHALHAVLVAVSLIGRHWFPLTAEEQKPEPPNPPAPKGCQCGCGRDNCKCGRAPGNTCQLPAVNENLLKSVQDQSQKPTELIGYAPAWCTACKSYKQRLGNGDAITSIRWVESEAPFKVRVYPVLYHAGMNRVLQGENISLSMDRVRQSFGIVPPKELANGITVGTLPREQVMQLRRVIGEQGNFHFGNKEFSETYYGVTLTAKQGFGAQWNTANGTTRIVLPQRPRLRYGILNQDIDAIAIGADKVTLELPWAPDVSFDLK